MTGIQRVSISMLLAAFKWIRQNCDSRQGNWHYRHDQAILTRRFKRV